MIPVKGAEDMSGKFARVEERTSYVGGDGIKVPTRRVVVGGCILPTPDLPYEEVRHWELACEAINVAHEKSLSTAEEVMGRMAEACKAAIRYDREIHACANDPQKMSSHCTAQGETLDDLYEAWRDKSREALESYSAFRAKGNK